MHTLKKHSTIALGYFLLIALLGVILRLFPITSIQSNYKFLVHTHSHVALLGWVYTALSTIIFKQYLQNANVDKKYTRIFWFTQVTIVGMLVSFPFTGYAFLSILFSTLFLVSSYMFAWLFFKFTPTKLKQRNSYKLIRIALWYMIISSLGPWMLGIIMQTSGQGSSLYKNAIYFYLHFQYNGWFIIAVLGIFIFILEQNAILFTKKMFNNFFWLLNSGVIATFFISILWMTPPILINSLSALGSIFQLIAFGLLLNLFKTNKSKLNSIFSPFLVSILKISGALFLVKLILQMTVCIPFIANLVSYNVDFVIGYIHWVFLGVVSIPILTFLFHYQLATKSKALLVTYISGFILTETLIFYKGIINWLELTVINNYYHYLAIASSIIFIALFGVFLVQFKTKKDSIILKH
jgi:hypothetical protein